MKTAIKSNNYEMTIEEIITVTSSAVVKALVEQGVIIPAQKEEPKPVKKPTKKTSAKVTKVTKEGNKKTSESKGQVRYCHHDKNGHLVVTKAKKSSKKSHKGWEYIKQADGTTKVVKH